MGFFFFFPNFVTDIKTLSNAGHWWLMSVIPATQETEIRRITVRSQPGQIVHETLSQKHPSQRRAGGVAQGVAPEFKPQYQKKKKKKKKTCEHLHFSTRLSAPGGWGPTCLISQPFPLFT
jgi:hypothetical protein